MKDLAGRVAVVTGAARGIGLALAHRFADDGMRIVLADLEDEPLARAEAALTAKGATALAVRTDVLRDEDVAELADRAFGAFGKVHVLCNNAGVAGGSGRPVWDAPVADWEWVLGVNLLGVLRGVRAFVPRMLANGDEGHVVNTASVAGFLTRADPYNVAKHGVVCLTEGLYKDFKARGAKLSASVLCPGWVNTRIAESGRNRPPAFGPPTTASALPPPAQERRARVAQLLKDGFAPEEIPSRVVDAVREDQFYIIPAQAPILDAVKRRFDEILGGRNPSPNPV